MAPLLSPLIAILDEERPLDLLMVFMFSVLGLIASPFVVLANLIDLIGSLIQTLIDVCQPGPSRLRS